MHVDRALVDRRVGARRLGRAEQLPGGDLDDREGLGRRRAQRDRRRRVGAGPPGHVARAGDAVAPAQLARALEQLRRRLPARPEELAVLARQGRLVRRAQQVRAVDQRRLVVEDRRLDGPVEELVGVPAEELVQRVLARHVHREAAPAPARAPPHLAQRRDGAGEGDDERAVELADVDAELERVGRDHGAQLPVHQPPLELAPLLGRVAGAVGSHELRQLGVLGGEVVVHEPAQHLDALARLHEADHPRALAHEPRQQLGRLAEGRAPLPERLVGERRVPDRDLALRRGRAVAVDQGEVLAARSGAPPARPGWRSSPRPSARAARCRTSPRCGAAGAARWRRASRTRRGRRAPRRRRRPAGGRDSRPRRRGWAGSRRAACRGW